MRSLRLSLHIQTRRSRIDQRLVFPHIPKGGGTSIRRAVARHYPPSAAVHLDAQASLAASEILDKDLDAYRQEMLLYFMAWSQRITEEIRRKVEEICEPDFEIYRHALVRSTPS